jgi:hypothetical protein
MLLNLHRSDLAMNKIRWRTLLTGRYTHAYFTDQHLLVVGANGKLTVWDLYTLKSVCCATMPQVLLQSSHPDSVQVRSDNGLKAFLLWRSGDVMYLWNVKQSGAPRCFRNVPGELLFNTCLLVHQTGSELRTYVLSGDVNVDPKGEDPTVVCNLQEYFPEQHVFGSHVASRTVCLDDRLAVAIGEQNESVFIFEVGAFLAPTCSFASHDLCPVENRRKSLVKLYREVNCQLNLTMIENVRCNKSEFKVEQSETREALESIEESIDASLEMPLLLFSYE